MTTEGACSYARLESGQIIIKKEVPKRGPLVSWEHDVCTAARKVHRQEATACLMR